VSFDENGDLADKTISVFQIKHDTVFPDGDMRQFHYIGVAPSA
jgi:branched-chain amino acid transport system substrate-binding protein